MKLIKPTGNYCFKLGIHSDDITCPDLDETKISEAVCWKYCEVLESDYYGAIKKCDQCLKIK